MTDIKNYTYSDINLWAGTVSNNALVFDEKSVEQNIMMILMTPLRSGWFDPGIGSNILTYLFDPIDDLTAMKIKREITTVLPRNGETRVVFTSVEVMADIDNQNYYIRIGYQAPGLDYEKFSFDFTLSQK
jgi:phage baseplate assembly protein W